MEAKLAPFYLGPWNFVLIYKGYIFLLTPLLKRKKMTGG
jgi:hypothetical protein